ncbi:MAG TPA: extracellular solute-binding protein, partial [Candidatus Limiplasma sp.]|nr:extracellular solute-binding protein [Candidatus Limiplasma sp.]
MKTMSKLLALLVGVMMLIAVVPASAEEMIAPDGAELSIWMVYQGDVPESPDEIVSVQKMEEITGVKINWQIATKNDATEKFGLMLASGDYPDIVIGASTYYPGGIDKGIEEGVFIDMTDLVAEYMPNYQALCNTNESTRKGTLTDSGTNAAVYVMNGNLEGPAREMVWSGILVRQDWLEKAGLDVPVTIDDWHTALTAYKDQFGASAPLMI